MRMFMVKMEGVRVDRGCIGTVELKGALHDAAHTHVCTHVHTRTHTRTRTHARTHAHDKGRRQLSDGLHAARARMLPRMLDAARGRL
jgi:hypothetical protein